MAPRELAAAGVGGEGPCAPHHLALTRLQSKAPDPAAPPLTSLLGRLVVRLAHQPAVLHEVELVARGQLPLAHHAGEAVQVVHEVLGAAHHLRGRDAQLARGALGPEAPAGPQGDSALRRRLRPERARETAARRAVQSRSPSRPRGARPDGAGKLRPWRSCGKAALTHSIKNKNTTKTKEGAYRVLPTRVTFLTTASTLTKLRKNKNT